MSTPVADQLNDQLNVLLAERAEAALRCVPNTIPRRPDPARPAPLSPAQSALWFLTRYQPNTAAYNVPVVVRLHGPVHQHALLDAVRDVAERHHLLRSVVIEHQDQVAALPLAAEAIPTAVRATSPQELEEELRAELAQPFALSSEPPMRAVLYEVAGAEPVLALTFHHIAFDHWSSDLVLADLSSCYRARLGGQPRPADSPLQYADVTTWAQSQAPDGASLDWWGGRLAGLAPMLTLPTDLPRPSVADWSAGHIPVHIPDSLAQRLDDFGRGTGCTPYMVLMAAWQILLARLSGTDDIAVGMPESGRHHPEVEGVIGCFVNTVVARTDLSGDPTGHQLLGRVRDVVLDAFAHSEVSFDQVVRRCLPDRSPAGAPLVQVLLNVLDEPMCSAQIADLAGTPVPTPYLTTQFDLTLDLLRGQTGYSGALVFRRDLLTPKTAAHWVRWFLVALHELIANAARPISTIELLTESERTELVAAGHGASLPAGRPSTIIEAVLSHARCRPASVAVSDRNDALSYAQLVEWANGAASALASQLSDREPVVGVCLPRDRFLPAALLAVMLGGHAYLPLEPDHPVERLGLLAADAGARVVVARGTALETAKRIPGVTVVDLDQLRPSDVDLAPVQRNDLAYVLYTSGSSGRPKGVEITHANLADFVTGISITPGVGSGDTVLALGSLSFDISVGEIWSALATGARCHLVGRSCAIDPAQLAAELAAGITVAIATPHTVRLLLESGWPGDPRLRLWVGGEAVDPQLARDLRPRVGELWNVYGPTEGTVIATAQRVENTAAPTVPIGSAIPGDRLYILDRHGRLSPPGVTGELYLGGAGVARGYRGRPELTDAAFVPDPFQPGARCYRTGDLVRWHPDTTLEFIGRRDRQVKVRGQRIELGEIETAVRAQPVVGDAVVRVQGHDADAHLVGYVTPAAVDTVRLEAELRVGLPDYLVPRRWVTLEALPVTSSGKIDVSALPDVAATKAHHGQPPTTEAELLVAEMWAAVLSRTGLTVTDNFFGLGGHSMAAARFAGRLGEALGCSIPVRLVFEHPVLADLAVAIERLVMADLSATNGPTP